MNVIPFPFTKRHVASRQLDQDRYVVRVADDQLDQAWDAFVQEAPGSHHVQASVWAEVKSVLGRQSTRVVVYRDDRIVGGVQVIIHHVPVFGPVGYVSSGPLTAGCDLRLTQLVLDHLLSAVRSRGIAALIVQPPADQPDLDKLLVERGFRRSPVDVGPTATVVIDLNRPLDQILAGMRKQTRKGIRRAWKRGLTVRPGTLRDLPTFMRLLQSTGRRQGFAPLPERYFTDMWRLMQPRGMVRLILAEFDGEAVAAQWIVAFGNRVVAKHCGWSGTHSNLRPNEAADWESIRWSQAMGYHHYDFEGIAPQAAQALLQGQPLPLAFHQTPTSYKLNFGGQTRALPNSYLLVFNRLIRGCYNAYANCLPPSLIRRAAAGLRVR